MPLISHPLHPVSCSQSPLLLFLHPSLPRSIPGCLYPAAFLLSLFQGWWLWLESRHRWQASLPSGEGLHSLNFLHFFPLFFFSLLQLKLLACNFSCLASLYLGVHDVRGKGRVLQGGGLSQTHELSSDQWGHQYQWKLDKGASRVSVAAID